MIFAKLLLYILPASLKNKIKRNREIKELKLSIERAKRTTVSKSELLDTFAKFNIDSDVLLHTSMTRIGRIEGGPKFIGETVLKVVGVPERTLLVSALPYRGSFKDYLSSIDTFDVRTAPVAMGNVNEFLSRVKGAERSLHPTHSLIAIGNKAIEYTFEHNIDLTPFSYHSPYFKLLVNNGYIMLFGASLNNLTYIHVIEDLLGAANPINPYLRKVYTVDCIDKLGNHVVVKTRCHNPFWGIFRDLEFMKQGLLECGAMKTAYLGESEISLISVKDFTLYYLNLLAHGRSIYGYHLVTPRLKNRIRQISSLIKENEYGKIVRNY